MTAELYDLIQQAGKEVFDYTSGEDYYAESDNELEVELLEEEQAVNKNRSEFEILSRL